MKAAAREAAISAVCSLGIVARNIPAAELAKALRVERAEAAEDGFDSARFRALITAVEALVWFVAANDDLIEAFESPVPAQAGAPLAAPVTIPDDWAA